jgi:hypothetical protein
VASLKFAADRREKNFTQGEMSLVTKMLFGLYLAYSTSRRREIKECPLLAQSRHSAVLCH